MDQKRFILKIFIDYIGSYFFNKKLAVKELWEILEEKLSKYKKNTVNLKN